MDAVLELIEDVKRNNSSDSFDQLYNSLTNMVPYSFCQRVLPNHDAEDIEQEKRLAVLKFARDFDLEYTSAYSKKPKANPRTVAKKYMVFQILGKQRVWDRLVACSLGDSISRNNADDGGLTYEDVVAVSRDSLFERVVLASLPKFVSPLGLKITKLLLSGQSLTSIKKLLAISEWRLNCELKQLRKPIEFLLFLKSFQESS
ncbi:hypothetical protein C4561_01720 [candidate division WWE3 bacterium]|uniref:Uncharacterized protein n=1 Tax=candidate division WWE3 bacterium TaxID=2053526 RepID=A0A3A4ZL90_UNCKA|nr:MAG: hypothetical protein C4561_01720 [candidate division WWE3 bacterium]